MIPIMKQQAPNIMPRYICSTCGELFPMFSHTDLEHRWKFCCICGEAIEWDNVKPVVWEDRNCRKCGRALIRLDEDGHPRWVNPYVDEDLCYECLREHCMSTDCEACQVNRPEDCPHISRKRALLTALHGYEECGDDAED